MQYSLARKIIDLVSVKKMGIYLGINQAHLILLLNNVGPVFAHFLFLFCYQ